MFLSCSGLFFPDMFVSLFAGPGLSSSLQHDQGPSPVRSHREQGGWLGLTEYDDDDDDEGDAAAAAAASVC